MAAAMKRRQHPNIGNQETERTPPEAGVMEVSRKTTTWGGIKRFVGEKVNTINLYHETHTAAFI